MKDTPKTHERRTNHFRRCAQGEIRHNSLRSACAALGTYCVFALHCALEMKGGH